MVEDGAAETKEDTQIGAAWRRLEILCRRLWDSDPPAAIELQTIIDEFRIAAHRSQRTIAALRRLHDELRESAAKDFERAKAEETARLVRQLQSSQERLAAAEAALAGKEDQISRLLSEFRAKAARTLESQEMLLSASVQQEEARARKMEAIFEQLSAKEAQQGARWEARQAALAAENKERTEALRSRQEMIMADLDSRTRSLDEHSAACGRELAAEKERLQAERQAWHVQRLAESRALAAREQELADKAENLADEFKKKRFEFERAKLAMQAGLAQFVQQNQGQRPRP